VGYGAALVTSLSTWLLAVRAPLWTDETVSYWQIAGGFKQIWARSIEGTSFPAYAYILWLTRTAFGDKELILRIPSILAMLAAAYVLYLCAREMFGWDASLIATLFFVLHRFVGFAAIDVRPYSFVLLLTNLTILMFLRWMKTDKIGYAAVCGITAAGILYFHYLFAGLLTGFVVYYLLSRRSSLRADLRPIGVALLSFAIFLLPVVPGLKYAYQTRTIHSFAPAPEWTWLLGVLNPAKGKLFVPFAFTLLAVAAPKLITSGRQTLNKLLFCMCVALGPALSLYVVSVNTPIHIFISRYLLVAVPGIALCWGWLYSLIDSHPLRAVFCFVFVALCVFQAYTAPLARKHEESWKESLAYADANAARDHAPLLMCSPLVEADYLPMPAVASESVLYAPLSYYKVNAPVIPLPRRLNDEAERQARRFLPRATQEHRRFLALAQKQSLGIIDYVAFYSGSTYSLEVLGNLDGIWVVEFVPRTNDPVSGIRPTGD